MFKKIILFSLVTALTWNSVLYADYMMETGSCTKAFLSLEGSYTRNSINDFQFIFIGFPTPLFSEKTQQPLGARAAVGVLWLTNDELGLSTELGWGYYGQTKLTLVGTGVFTDFPVAISNNISGFDLLVGASYLTSCYSLFLKAGPLVETNFTNFSAQFIPSPLLPRELTFKSNRSSVIPAIKVGGSYIFDEYWSLTVAYMYAFGHRVFTTETFDPFAFGSTLDLNLKAPSLKSVMVGVQFLM